MFKKTFISLIIVFLLSCCVFAQTSQTLTLKPGFNFISFTASISSTPAQLKTQNPVIEDIYLFSAAAGSFLSATEGTLSTLAAGKGYIIKSNSASDTVISIPGDAVQTIGNINLKTGFNLIGFSKIPSNTVSFSSLMNVYSAIKGIYKWSPAAGSFIQVVRDNSGAVTLLDGADPSFKSGDSYFFNMAEDTTINYDGPNIILGNGPPAPIAKTLELTGIVGASAPASPSYSLARAIDLSTMQISVYDEINNVSVEGATIIATDKDTFKATLPVATTDRYLSVLVKNTENKIIYKSFLGRIPKAIEVTENTVKISNIKVSDESTARAIIVLENRSKIPITAVIAKKSVDTSIHNTDFALALEERIAGLEDRVPELKQAVNLIANVLTTPGVDNAIKEKVTEFTFSESSKLLSSYVSLLQNADTLQTVNNISVPAQLYIGSKQLTAQSTQTDIYETVTGLNETIGQRVEMPVLDPPPGSYASAIAVKMTCATPNANIIYDYGDGRQGINYTGPVVINKTCKLNVAAFRSDWPMSWHSKFVNATYTIGSDGGETTETKTLTYISLDKTSEVIAVTAEKYDLSSIKITAHYSNGDSMEVQTARWEMISSPGAFSYASNSYILSGKTGEAIFNAIYAENGIDNKAEFKLKVITQAEIENTLASIKLNKTEDSISSGASYDLAQIKAIANYLNGTTKEVTVEWSKISGSGTLANLSYIGTTIETAILKASYTESGVIMTSDFTLNINNQVITSKTIIDQSGGKILINDVMFEVPPGAVDATTQIEISNIPNIESRLPAPGQTFYKLNTTGIINNAKIKIPINNEETEKDFILTCIDCTNNLTYRIKPTIKDNYCLFTFGQDNSTSSRVPARQTVDPTTINLGILGKDTGDRVSLNGVIFVVYKARCIDCNKLKEGLQGDNFRWPHYRQYYQTCWATTWLMLMKGYKAFCTDATYTAATGHKLNISFDSIFKIFNTVKKRNVNNKTLIIDKYGIKSHLDVGLLMDMATCLKVEELTSKFNPKISVVNYACDNVYALIDLVVTSIQQKKPVKVDSALHSILICGYEFNENSFKPGPLNAGPIDILNTYFYVNNPGGLTPNAGYYAPSRKISVADFLAEMSPGQPRDINTLKDFINIMPFICYTGEKFITPRYLQTIHLSTSNPTTEGGVKLIDNLKNEIKHTVWDDQAKEVNEIAWVSGTGKMELFDNIHFINIPIANSSSVTDVKVQLSIYKDNMDASGNFPDNAIVSGDMIAEGNNNTLLIPLAADSLKHYDFKTNTTIVKKLVEYIQQNPFITNKFVMRVDLKDSSNNTIDRFDVKTDLNMITLLFDKSEIIVPPKTTYDESYEGYWQGHIYENNTMKTPLNKMKWAILTESEYLDLKCSYTDYPEVVYNDNAVFSNPILSSDHCLSLIAGQEIDLNSFPELEPQTPVKKYHIIAISPDNVIGEKEVTVKILRITPDEDVEVIEGQEYFFKAFLGLDDITNIVEWGTGTSWETINQGKFTAPGSYRASTPIWQTTYANIWINSREPSFMTGKRIKIIKK